MNPPKQLSLPWYTASVLVMILMIVLYHQSGNHLRAEATRMAMLPVMERPANHSPLPEGIRRMQGNRRVFVGGQLTAENLTNFLASYQIDHVVDLAHEEAADEILTEKAERFIVEKTGATYWPLNIEGRNDRLNQKALAQIDTLLDSGEVVFIHCLHGIHRVGVATGRAYARERLRWEEIVALLGWDGVVGDIRYRRYVRDVYEQVEKHSK